MLPATASHLCSLNRLANSWLLGQYARKMLSHPSAALLVYKFHPGRSGTRLGVDGAQTAGYMLARPHLDECGSPPAGVQPPDSKEATCSSLDGDCCCSSLCVLPAPPALQNPHSPPAGSRSIVRPRKLKPGLPNTLKRTCTSILTCTSTPGSLDTTTYRTPISRATAV